MTKSLARLGRGEFGSNVANTYMQRMQDPFPLPSDPRRLSADVIDGMSQAIARHYRAYDKLFDRFGDEKFDDAVDAFLWFSVTTFAIRDWLKKENPGHLGQFEQHICSTQEWKVVRDLSNRTWHLDLSTPSLASLSLGRDFLGADRYELKIWDGQSLRSAHNVATILKQNIARIVYIAA